MQGIQLKIALSCRLDITKAPLLLGQLLGNAISQKSFGSEALQEVSEPIEDPEARRELLVHVLKTVQVRSHGPHPFTHNAATCHVVVSCVCCQCFCLHFSCNQCTEACSMLKCLLDTADCNHKLCLSQTSTVATAVVILLCYELQTDAAFAVIILKFFLSTLHSI